MKSLIMIEQIREFVEDLKSNAQIYDSSEMSPGSGSGLQHNNIHKFIMFPKESSYDYDCHIDIWFNIDDETMSVEEIGYVYLWDTLIKNEKSFEVIKGFVINEIEKY